MTIIEMCAFTVSRLPGAVFSASLAEVNNELGETSKAFKG